MLGKLSLLINWLAGRNQPTRGRFDRLLPEEDVRDRAVAHVSDTLSIPDIQSVPLQGNVPDRSKIARVFDSVHPVRVRDELFGRDQELTQLLAGALDFGQHTIIHGARGSGKTSLARVFGDHADQSGAIVIYMACEPGASFADLLMPYLRAIPASALDISERNRFKDQFTHLPPQFGPRTIVDMLTETVTSPVIFIFDEFDSVTDPQVKDNIASAMKLLSDALSNVLFMLVGIARSVADVIDSHPSLRRHMRVVALGRIGPESVGALIGAGEMSTGVLFTDYARTLIARASCGSPFHVRLFCHHAALAAARRGSFEVSAADARAGLLSAVENWATMNVDDARRFVALIDGGGNLQDLERAARTAALNDRLSSDTAGARALQGSLYVEGTDMGSMIFRDSLAPQFLISCIILAEVPPVNQPSNALNRESANVVIA